MDRRAALSELARRRIGTQPLLFLFSLARTMDEHDKDHPVKGLPRKAHIEALANAWTSHRLLAVPKSRQMQCTWTLVSLHLWDAMFHSHKRIMFRSKKAEDARELLRKARFVWEHLPSELRTPCRWRVDNAHFGNGSIIMAVPQGSDQVRGYTFSRGLDDEIAFQDKPEESFGAVKPTIDGGDGYTAVSTPALGFFHDMVGPKPMLEKGLAETEHNGFHVLWLHYSADPSKDPYTVDGRRWFDEATKGYQGGHKSTDWRREYELDFLAGAGDSFFNEDKVRDWFNSRTPPTYTAYFQGKEGTVVAGPGPLSVWQNPVADVRYIIGADVGGGVGKDASVGCVLESTSRRQVAEWYSQEHDPAEFAHELAYLGRFYNYATLAPEVNSSGNTTLHELLHDIQYPHIYHRWKIDGQKEHTRAPGFLTSFQSRKDALTRLKASIMNGTFVPESKALVYEMMNFVLTQSYYGTGRPHPNGGKIQAAPGHKDDRVMAAAIANFVAWNEPHTNAPSATRAADEWAPDWLRDSIRTREGLRGFWK